jgi:hypothetical protein
MRNAELKEKSKDTHLNWEFGIWNAETRELRSELGMRNADLKEKN